MGTTPPEKDHYTAHVEVTRTVTKTGLGGSPSRTVMQIANVTLRADSIEKLIAKAGAHLQLVEDV